VAYLQLGHVLPPWAVNQICSKLKISHTAVIAARVAKQRRQGDRVWFVHKTVKVVSFPQTLLPHLLQVFRRLGQLNESSTASQEHDPTGSISNNCSTIDIAKHHVLEYWQMTVLQNIFSLQQLTSSPIFFDHQGAGNIPKYCHTVADLCNTACYHSHQWQILQRTEIYQKLSALNHVW